MCEHTFSTTGGKFCKILETGRASDMTVPAVHTLMHTLWVTMSQINPYLSITNYKSYIICIYIQLCIILWIGLHGQRLPARRRCLCQTTVVCRTLICSWTRNSFGDRTFAAAGSQVWNSLPPNLRLCGLSYGQFRRLLKTFLFGKWGHGAVWMFLTALTRNVLTYLLTYIAITCSLLLPSEI